MSLKQQQGYVETELNAKKGIWCEWCGKDCEKEHLITIEATRFGQSEKQLACVECAQNLVTCLQRSLVDAVLTEKEDTT